MKMIRYGIIIIMFLFVFSLDESKQKEDPYELLIRMAWLFIFGILFLSTCM